MSSGAFTNAKYSTDTGDVHPCRIQEETFGFTSGGIANAQPVTAINRKGSARMSSSQKRKGVNARTIRFKFTTAPDEYEQGSILTLPVFIKANWDGYNIGDACTYLATAGTIVGKSPEGIK